MSRFRVPWRIALFVGFCLVLMSPVGAAQPTVDEILRRVAERSQRADFTPPQVYYLCTKQTVTEEMDGAGRVTKRKVKVGESRSNSNGADAHKWGSKNGIEFNQGLFQRYLFRLERIDVLDGRAMYVLSFVPRDPPAPVRQIQDRLLNRATGTLWVDKEDYELTKAQIALDQPVSFGILGAVDVLRFGFERARTPEGGWLTRWMDTSFKGRKFVIPVQFRKRVDCTDFRKLPG